MEEAKRAIESANKTGKKGVSIVVIGMDPRLVCCHSLITTLGHVDAGKSTLMGRLLYDLGRLDEKTKTEEEDLSITDEQYQALIEEAVKQSLSQPPGSPSDAEDEEFLTDYARCLTRTITFLRVGLVYRARIRGLV